MEITTEEDLSINSRDKVLKCGRLTWKQTVQKKSMNQEKSAKLYQLISFEKKSMQVQWEASDKCLAELQIVKHSESLWPIR